MSGLRKFLIVLVMAISMCVAPARAYAEDGGGGGHSFDAGIGYGVVLGPVSYGRDNLTGSHKVGYVVYANNRYDAACYALGLDVADVNGITDEQRAKLSNAETGGDFYTFAQRAYRFGANTVPSWVPIGSNLSELFGQGDAGKVWAIDGFVGYPFGSEYQDAKEDMQTILDGEDIGGGGSGGDVTFGETFTAYIPYTHNYRSINFIIDGHSYNNAIAYSTESNNSLIPNEVTVNLPSGSLDALTDNVDMTDKYLLLSFQTYSSTNSQINVYIYAIPNSIDVTTIQDTMDGVTFTRYNYSTSQTYPALYASAAYSVYSGNTINITNANFRYLNVASLQNFTNSGYGRNSSSIPVIPPSNWPDAPETVTPSPPSLPEPTSVTEPTYPSKVVRITNTYTADLQGILDAMDEHCQHLQDEIYNDLKNSFDGMTDYLGDEFDELKQYLHDLFEWLADELDFTVSGSGYSDSTVVSWLKKIWSKIGSGVNTRPVDPLVNTDGAWDWLTDLFAGFLSVLAEKGLELSGALHGLLDDLVEKFPFSVPWDVLALLALFTAEPVSPLIEFDIPMLGGTVVPVSIDLSNYDALMSIVRPVELVAFGAWLLWLTPEVLKSLNVSIGGGD